MENLSDNMVNEVSGDLPDSMLLEALQKVAQTITQMQQNAERRQEERMKAALRRHEERIKEEWRKQVQETDERFRRLEEALQLRERRNAEHAANAQSEEGSGAAGGSLSSLQERHSWREPVAQLEARSKKLEESVERAVESVFPRVALLVSHLEAKAETSRPRDTAGLAESTTVNASTTTTVTSTCSGASTTTSSNSTSTSKATFSSSSIASTSRSSPPSNSLPSLVASSQPPTCSTQPPTNQRRSVDLAEDLYSAARSGNLEDTRRLLDAGANANCPHYKGRTPLMKAASQGHTPVVALLLESGVDVHRRDADGWTALHHASKGDREGQCVRMLLDAGADPNSADTTSGRTPLMEAALQSHTAVVALLLERGADVHKRDAEGCTALHSAVEGDEEGESVRLLLDAGADPNCTDVTGRTPLMEAVLKGHISVVALLLESGADVHLSGPLGWTALHIAAVVGNEAAVRVLLGAGASKHIRNNEQKTPVQLAKYDSIRRLLR